VRSGWLLKDGEVLASVVWLDGWRAHVVSKREFTDGIGAVAVDGPAVVLRTPVVRVSDESHLRTVSTRRPVHLVGPGRHAIALVPELASALSAGDELQIRGAP
jgi:hypothetical protein